MGIAVTTGLLSKGDQVSQMSKGKLLPLSYTKMTTFTSCPKKFYHMYIVKDVPYKPSPEAQYGIDRHKAVEDYINGKGSMLANLQGLLPEHIDLIQSIKWRGSARAEVELAVNQDMRPCGWWDSDCFVRGKLDLLQVSDCGEYALAYDWKFTKRHGKETFFSDGKLREEQSKYDLEMAVFAMLVMLNYPSVKSLTMGLVWMGNVNGQGKSPDIDFRLFERIGAFLPESLPRVKRRIENLYNDMQATIAKGQYEQKVSPLCNGWCDVTMCDKRKEKS